MNEAKQKQKFINYERCGNDGAAMIVVVCIMAVVMILSVTILMTTYQMMATVADEGRDEMYDLQASSFCAVLQKELESFSLSGTTTNELVQYIDAFMANENEGAPLKETLTAAAPVTGGVYGGITLVLDKQVSRGNLVIVVSVDDGHRTMASTTCKYEVTNTPIGRNYEFRGFYRYPSQARGEAAPTP